MALEGTLEDFSLADIFQLIGIQRKTGILSLKNSQETVTVTFHQGMVIGADSMPKKLEDRIGKVLVKTGLITQQKLDDALGHQGKTLQKIGFILVDQKYISREQLKEALQIQVTQMIYRLFRWNAGEYYFDQKAHVDPDADESIPPVSAESILMEGIHMIDEWPVIEKRIPNTNIVFKTSVPSHELELSDGDEDDFGRSENSDKVRLGREEYSVYQLVNGKNTVSEIIESSKFGEFHTSKALYDLLERKIIEHVAPAPFASMQHRVSIKTRSESKIDLVRFLFPVLGVLILLAVFVGWKDPMRMPFFSFFAKEDSDNLKAHLNFTRLNQVDSSVSMYFYIHGSLPSRLEDLVENNYLREEDIVDPWSRPYVYDVSGDTYILSSNTSVSSQNKFQVRRTVGRVEPAAATPPKSKSPSTIRFENTD